jgi:uncharacterized membrane protein YeiH
LVFLYIFKLLVPVVIELLDQLIVKVDTVAVGVGEISGVAVGVFVGVAVGVFVGVWVGVLVAVAGGVLSQA